MPVEAGSGSSPCSLKNVVRSSLNLVVSPVHFLNLKQARTPEEDFRSVRRVPVGSSFGTLAKYSGTEERALPKPCGGD